MRRLAILVPCILACSGGNSSNPGASVESQFVAALADGGVRCLHREPPPFHACDGLDAGASCSVPDDDAGQAGFCKVLRDGRMLCAGADDDDDRAEAGDGGHHDGGDDDGDRADGGDHHGEGGMDGRRDGGMGWMHDGGFPPPVQAAVDACLGRAADDVCSVSFRDHTIQGGCRVAPDGRTLICAPLCSHR